MFALLFITISVLLKITPKPSGVDDINAAGVLYAGLTAWSAIYISGLAGGLKGAKTSNGSRDFPFMKIIINYTDMKRNGQIN